MELYYDVTLYCFSLFACTQNPTLLIIWLENQYYNSVELEILKNIGEKPIKDPSLELISNDPFWLHFIVSPKLRRIGEQNIYDCQFIVYEQQN